MKTQKNNCKAKIEASALTAGQKSFLRRQKLQKLYIFWSRILIFAAFVMLWQISADMGWIDSFYFSSPIAISKLFWHDITDMSLLSHIGITLLESGISFMLIILFSLLTATFFWFYPSLGKMFEPFLIVLNSLPKSALAPLIIVWLGTGPRTIILCGISVGIFGCILNLYQSFAQTDPERLKLIETLGGTKLQAFTKVVFPGNIPTFISLSKVNIGLGYLIIYGSQVFKLDMVILSIVILCVIAMVIYGLLNLLEKKISY